MFDLTPRRDLPKSEWIDAHRVARLCARGQVKHGPVNMLAKQWVLRQIKGARNGN